MNDMGYGLKEMNEMDYDLKEIKMTCDQWNWLCEKSGLEVNWLCHDVL